MNAPSREAECLAIGGGLAGSMLAVRLAAAGRPVTLLERETRAHHKVCGEFLSGEAVAYLHSAGIQPLTLGGATIRKVRLAAGGSVAEALLPFTALSLSRFALDEAMLHRAAEAGCRIERGVEVTTLTHEGDLWVARTKSGRLWRASNAFLACGKHNLSGWERRSPAKNDFIGFKIHLRLSPREREGLREAMELFLFRGGYGGLSLIEEDRANLCLVVRREVFRAQNGWAALLASIGEENRPMRSRLKGATALWERPLAIYPIPYGYIAGNDGPYRVGDQAAVIPSFTGDGMSIALHSGALAAEFILAGRNAHAYHEALGHQLKQGMRLSNVVSKMMVSGLGRVLAPLAAGIAPEVMNRIADWTRIPARALATQPTA